MTKAASTSSSAMRINLWGMEDAHSSQKYTVMPEIGPSRKAYREALPWQKTSLLVFGSELVDPQAGWSSIIITSQKYGRQCPKGYGSVHAVAR